MLAYLQFGNAAADLRVEYPSLRSRRRPSMITTDCPQQDDLQRQCAEQRHRNHQRDARDRTGTRHGGASIQMVRLLTLPRLLHLRPVANIVSDTFTYCGNGACSNATPANLKATVAISVVNNSNAPPVAVADHYATNVSTLIKMPGRASWATTRILTITLCTP